MVRAENKRVKRLVTNSHRKNKYSSVKALLVYREGFFKTTSK